MLEVPVAYLVDQKKLPRKRVVWILCSVIFLFGIPSILSQGASPALSHLAFYKNRDFLTFIADMTDITLTVGGCLMCIFITYQWGIKKMNAELSTGDATFIGSATQRYINFTIAYICPALLGVLSILIVLDKFWGITTLF